MLALNSDSILQFTEAGSEKSNSSLTTTQLERKRGRRRSEDLTITAENNQQLKYIKMLQEKQFSFLFFLHIYFQGCLAFAPPLSTQPFCSPTPSMSLKLQIDNRKGSSGPVRWLSGQKCLLLVHLECNPQIPRRKERSSSSELSLGLHMHALLYMHLHAHTHTHRMIIIFKVKCLSLTHILSTRQGENDYHGLRTLFQ